MRVHSMFSPPHRQRRPSMPLIGDARGQQLLVQNQEAESDLARTLSDRSRRGLPIALRAIGSRRPGVSTWSALPRSRIADRGVTMTILLAVTSLALLLRIINVQGFLGGDDAIYIQDARLLAQGHFLPGSNQWDVRIGIIAPTALALRLFGLHEWSIVLYPLCLSLLSLPLIYFLGQAFCCRQVGLLAALLQACFPQDIFYATAVYADLPGAFWGALAVLLVYLSRAAVPPARR